MTVIIIRIEIIKRELRRLENAISGVKKKFQLLIIRMKESKCYFLLWYLFFSV
jgi:hypothetical protein